MRKTDFRPLFERMSEAYFDLRALAPRHELLGYFYSDEAKIWLKLNTNFLERFASSVNPGSFIYFDEFLEARVRSSWRNYKGALEEAVVRFIRE